MEREELLKEITDSKVIDISAKDAVLSLMRENRNLRNILKEKEDKIDELNEFICSLLKNKIGEKIYWAEENWAKIETHIITDVRYDICDTDFFDTNEVKYKGKKMILIETDNDGYYIVDQINKTLFFDEEEAKAHTRKD